jgi:hypothetical protein
MLGRVSNKTCTCTRAQTHTYTFAPTPLPPPHTTQSEREREREREGGGREREGQWVQFGSRAPLELGVGGAHLYKCKGEQHERDAHDAKQGNRGEDTRGCEGSGGYRAINGETRDGCKHRGRKQQRLHANTCRNGRPEPPQLLDTRIVDLNTRTHVLSTRGLDLYILTQ